MAKQRQRSKIGVDNSPKKTNNVKMGLFGIIVIVLLVVPLVIFFDWFWKKYPWAEKPINGLKIWGIIMVLVLLLAVLVS
jgi:uncharacterized membrane protein